MKIQYRWKFFAKHPTLWKGERCLAVGSEVLDEAGASAKCASLGYCYAGITDARIELVGDEAGVDSKKGTQLWTQIIKKSNC